MKTLLAIGAAAIAALVLRKKKGVSGIGESGETYYIILDVYNRIDEDREPDYIIGRYVYCGYEPKTWYNDEPHARWISLASRWLEYEPKEYQSLKWAEKAYKKIIENNDDSWNDCPTKLRIVTSTEFLRMWR